MKTPIHITDVHCSQTSKTAKVMVGFSHAGARFHFWLDPDSLEIEKGIGRQAPTLYKNPPANTPQSSVDYFRTRLMDCSKGPSKIVADQALRIAREEGLIDRAREKVEQDQAAAQEQQRQELVLARVREAAWPMKQALETLIAAAYSDGWPAGWGLVKEAATAALALAGEGADTPLGPVAVILDGGLCQGVVTPDKRLQGVTFAVVDYDTEGADGTEVVMVVSSGGEAEEEACVRLEEIKAAVIDVPETIKRVLGQEPEAVAARMPDGSVVSPWDERLRSAGGTPIFHRQG